MEHIALIKKKCEKHWHSPMFQEILEYIWGAANAAEEELINRQKWIDALTSAGVDKWNGYDHVMEEYYAI